MKDLAALEDTLREGPDSELEEALLLIDATSDSERLSDLAELALETALEKPHAMAYGPRMMLAGAAITRASTLRAESPARLSDEALLEALNQLQSQLDTNALSRSLALQHFGPLGAQFLLEPRRPFLDLEVDATHDDSVLLWSTGAAALPKRGQAPI